MDYGFNTSRYKVLASTPNKRLCYYKGQLWIEKANHEKAKIKMDISILSRYRLAERILRLTPRLGFSIYDKLFFSMHGCLFQVDEYKSEAHVVYQYRFGMTNPLTVCKGQQNRQEVVYWGEYWENPAREQVNIIMFDGDMATKVCTISGIKHIHTIVWDQYRSCFWITTGDSDDESRIYKASPGFEKLEIVFSGRQIYRTCALFPTEKGIIYATDSPLCSNSLMFSKKQQDQFLEPIVVAPMPGPCIFSQKFSENFYFSTSVEPRPKQHKISYLWSRKIGPGNIDYNSHVICVNRDLVVTEILVAAKDIHNMFFFQYGNLQLSYDTYADALAAYCTSIKKYDGQTIYLSDSRNR